MLQLAILCTFDWDQIIKNKVDFNLDFDFINKLKYIGQLGDLNWRQLGTLVFWSYNCDYFFQGQTEYQKRNENRWNRDTGIMETW